MLRSYISGKWMTLAGLVGLVVVIGSLSLLYTPLSGANRQSALADEIGRSVGQTSDGNIVYIAASKNTEAHGGEGMMEGSDLTVLDPQTGKTRVIAENVWAAHVSPNGKEIVAAGSQNKVRLYSVDGAQKAQIGNNGSNPIFTHDGKYVAYQKLADEGKEYLELVKNAKGLALYDVATGKERMLTKHSGDDWPIGFSADMKYFYFNASRPYSPSVLGIVNIESGLYSLNMDTGTVTRLTNTDEQKALDNGPTMSFIGHDSLWTSDRLKAVSGIGKHGTYEYIFDGNGGVKSIERIGDGGSPRWVVQDKSVEVSTGDGNKQSRTLINIK